MTSIVSSVHLIEDDYGGSVIKAPMFEDRLVKIRKQFNSGTDPLDEQFHDFDFKSAQLMLDQGIDKGRISTELGITQNQLRMLIGMGALNTEKWREITSHHVSSVSQYVLYRGNRRVAVGTIKELARQMETNVGTIRYWKSARYQNREHEVTYSLSEV